ncbi:ubiquitin carboxyl-terminal hydrolase 12-like protein [Tanacetum coccineum]
MKLRDCLLIHRNGVTRWENLEILHLWKVRLDDDMIENNLGILHLWKVRLDEDMIENGGFHVSDEVQRLLMSLVSNSGQWSLVILIEFTLQIPSGSNPSEVVSSEGKLMIGSFQSEPSAGMLLSGLAGMNSANLSCKLNKGYLSFEGTDDTSPDSNSSDGEDWDGQKIKDQRFEEGKVFDEMFERNFSNMARIFGEPFLLVVLEGETLAKVRIQKKLEVPDEEYSKWKFSHVSWRLPTPLQDSDIVSSYFQISKVTL